MAELTEAQVLMDLLLHNRKLLDECEQSFSVAAVLHIFQMDNEMLDAIADRFVRGPGIVKTTSSVLPPELRGVAEFELAETTHTPIRLQGSALEVVRLKPHLAYFLQRVQIDRCIREDEPDPATLENMMVRRDHEWSGISGEIANALRETAAYLGVTLTDYTYICADLGVNPQERPNTMQVQFRRVNTLDMRSRFRKHIHGVSVRPTFIQSAGGDALGDILVDLAWTDHQHFEKAFRSLHAVLQKLGILRHTTRLTRS